MRKWDCYCVSSNSSNDIPFDKDPDIIVALCVGYVTGAPSHSSIVM